MAVPSIEGTAQRAKALFHTQFNTQPAIAAAAPGRVNLIENPRSPHN